MKLKNCETFGREEPDAKLRFAAVVPTVTRRRQQYMCLLQFQWISFPRFVCWVNCQIKKNYKIAIEQNTEETKSFFAKRPCVRKWDSPHLIIENGTVKKFTYLTKERLNSKVGSNEDYDVNS